MLLASTTSVPAGARSQLAGFPKNIIGNSKNTILVNLGGTFGTARFTSSDASRVLRLDHTYLSKVLCRLRMASLLRIAEKRSRAVGGLGYVYEVSPKGWKRIRYLQNKAEPARPAQVSGDLFQQTLATSYVLNGQGHVGDCFMGVFLKHTALSSIRVPSVLDEVGALLCQLNPGFFGVEFARQLILNAPINTELKGWLTVKMRAERLQELDYIPKDLQLSTFIPSALIRGATESGILLGLALRQVANQQREIIGLKVDNTELTRTKRNVESDRFNAERKYAATARMVDDNSQFLLDVANALDSFNSTDTIVAPALGRGKLDLNPFRTAAVSSAWNARVDVPLGCGSRQDIISDYLSKRIDIRSEACSRLRRIILERVRLNIDERERINGAYA